ncbi:unnamed protein product [Dracunculus medinensis]|uniref:PlsC domain-containing protein n=1 Tax=Dracunculus medinensis TaxID=318479 RepID=A0A158Q4G3_DRAME|nr:unnamed protein product [Dracunculus medinensis]
MIGAEHLLVFVCAVLSPIVVLFVTLLFVFSSLINFFGLRKKYVQSLLKIFKWSARQIHSSEGLRQDGSEREFSESNSDCDEELNSAKLSMFCRKRRGSGIIQRRRSLDLYEEGNEIRFVRSRGWATVDDSLEFVKHGIEVIIQDDVTNRFEAEQLATWNMLTRTSISFYQHINWKVTLLWGAGFLFRYLVLLPIRLIFLTSGLIFMVVSTALIGFLTDGPLKTWLNKNCMLCCYLILSGSVTAIITFHNEQNKLAGSDFGPIRSIPGICVANHTSPIDVAILGIDNVYAYVGQRHGGLLGFLQHTLSHASSHVWFERDEERDRLFVAAKLRDHVNQPDKLPILIFPEGTCINNTSVMMFKKGSFEATSVIYPIAIKYDPLFGDAFWNSSEQNWLEYVFRTLTSWAIICDVWYLKPMHKLANENAVSFANRVKKEIAECSGLVDLEWDGGLKRTRVPAKMINENQKK